MQNQPSAQITNSTKLTRRTVLAASLVGWGFWSSSTAHDSQDRRFVLPAFQPTELDPIPRFVSRWIEHDVPLGFVHCASFSESIERELICTWYGGSREGARDVCIWMSKLDLSSQSESHWRTPLAVMDPQRAQQGAQQFIKKVGNSLVFHDDLNRLWMIYVSIAMGGWSTSSLNATYSTDGGSTWSPSQRLWLSPMLNISELVRCPVIKMRSGEIGVPVYHECAGVFPEMLWLRPGKENLEYSKSRIGGGRQWLQPSVVPTGEQTALCYLRCANHSRRVGLQATSDAGASWTSPDVLQLPNPNSAVCAVLMPNSGVLLALNHSADKRDSLSLVYSANGISNWQVVAKLDDEREQKFSYPTIVRDRDGTIHLVYSWRMQKLRHVSFNDAWVYQQLNQTPVAGSNFDGDPRSKVHA